MKFDYFQTQTQTQTISQNQIESLRMLALTTPELREFLKKEYMENPMLELSEHSSSAGISPEPVTYRHSLAEYTDPQISPDIPSPETYGIREVILEQLPPDLPDPDRRVVEYLLDELDEKGFCRVDAAAMSQELNRIYGYSHAHSARNILQILEILKECEPVGIFSADLRECLLRQLSRSGRENTTVFRIVSSYYKELMEGKISTLSRTLKISTLEVRKCIEEIAALNPVPLRGFSDGQAEYHEPDVILTRQKDGSWSAFINDDWTENYSVCDYYVRIMQTTEDPDLLAYFEKKLVRAKQILLNIRQRRQTILSVTIRLAEIQNDFLCRTGPLQALTMSRLAEELNIHPSTVSRALKDKWIQYPGGMIAAKKLFSTALESSGSSGAVSSSDVKSRIAAIIDGEDRSRPLSDAAIAALLTEEGIRISRRGVAKYRTELGIRGSFERKD